MIAGALLAGASVAALAFTIGYRLGRRGRRNEEEEVDPMSFLRQAQGVETQMVKVRLRAERAEREGDQEALDAATAEADHLLERVADIRLEQIACQERGWKR